MTVNLTTLMTNASIGVCLAILSIASAANADDRAEPVVVNADNFVRAETAAQFDRIVEMAGGVNRFFHLRGPTPLDKQTVIRMNRDTIYSAAVVDISKGATVTLPDAGTRYRSMMVVNEANYINAVYLDGGAHELTKEQFGSNHVWIGIRTLVDSNSADDIKAVHQLQDAVRIEATSAMPFTAPDYDQISYKATLDPLLNLGKGVPDTTGWFGSKEDTTPIGHLVGTAVGFGGLPQKHAFYLNVNPGLPVGEYQLTAKDVPVRAFWSVSLYNDKGYFQKNPEGAYNFNSVNAKKNSDGSITINFGGCDDGRVNCLPIMEGWNYGVRLYEPEKAILDGSYVFPSVEKVSK